jgi:hypothetical protein
MNTTESWKQGSSIEHQTPHDCFFLYYSNLCYLVSKNQHGWRGISQNASEKLDKYTVCVFVIDLCPNSTPKNEWWLYKEHIINLETVQKWCIIKKDQRSSILHLRRGFWFSSWIGWKKHRCSLASMYFLRTLVPWKLAGPSQHEFGGMTRPSKIKFNSVRFRNDSDSMKSETKSSISNMNWDNRPKCIFQGIFHMAWTYKYFNSMLIHEQFSTSTHYNYWSRYGNNGSDIIPSSMCMQLPTCVDIQTSLPLRNKKTCLFQYGTHATMIMHFSTVDKSSFSITMLALASS